MFSDSEVSDDFAKQRPEIPIKTQNLTEHPKKTPPSTGAPYFWRWTELKPLQFVHHVQAPISPTETKKRFKTAYQYNLILHL